MIFFYDLLFCSLKFMKNALWFPKDFFHKNLLILSALKESFCDENPETWGLDTYLRIFSLTPSQSRKLIPKADLKWVCPFYYSVLFSFGFIIYFYICEQGYWIPLNKPALPAAHRPFPMQLHQQAKSTHSAKLPYVLNH